MWSLTNINLPTTSNNYNNSCINSILKPQTNLTNSPIISYLFKSIAESTTSDIIPGLIPNTYIAQLDIIPNYIRSGSTVYTLANDFNNPQPGEFVINNNQVIIYSPKPITSIFYITSTLNTMRVTNVPSIFTQIPIYGDININDSWQEHPTCSMNLITTIQYINEFRSNFKQGNIIDLYDFSFYVNNYSENIDNLNNIVQINVSLKGKWDVYVNRPIPYLKLNDTAGNYLDPDCQIYFTSDGSSTYLSLNELANRINCTITGVSTYIKIKSTTANQTTTIQNELSNILDINSSFVDYSNKNSIVIKRIENVNSFNYSTRNLISPFTTNINRLPNYSNNNTSLPSGAGINSSRTSNKNINYNGLVPNIITNSTDYIISENINIIPYPTVANFTTNDNFNVSGKIISEPTTILQNPLQQRKIVKTHYFKGDTNPEIPPANISVLKTLDLNYDRSGVTKTSIEVWEEDGFPMQEITRKYGFAYRASDITVNSSYLSPSNKLITGYHLEGNPANWWGLIEETDRTYSYDDNTGYLLGYDTVGRKLLRVTAEDDNLPTLKYYYAVTVQGNTPSANGYDMALNNTYNFQWVNYYNAKRYLLVQHRDYYEQFQSEEALVKVCNRDGTSSWINNPAYVPSMFAIEETEETSSFLSVDNPNNILRQSTDPIYPPLTTGQETFNRTIIHILDSTNTNPSFIKNSNTPTKDRYISYTSNFTAQEPGFSAIVEQTTENTSDGIPQVQTRKTPKYELVNMLKEDPNSIYKGSKYRYVVWTQPYTGGYPRLGSYSFDKAKTSQDVFNAITNQLKIDDVRNTLSSTCTIPINLNIRSGDKINIDGFKRRVVSATHNLTIQGIDINGNCLVTSTGTQLNMGIERVPLDINKKLELSTQTNKTSSSINVYNKGLQLGSILSSNLPGRGK